MVKQRTLRPELPVHGAVPNVVHGMQKKEKPFYKIFIEVTADELGLDIPGVVQKTGLTDKQVRTIITRQMKVAPLDLALQLTDTLNVPLEVWLGVKNYSPTELSADAYEVARAYDRADLKSRNMVRMALAAAKLKEELSLKKEHIRFFLHQFADMDYTDIDCQKRLIKIFLNSVFVYDDKVVLTFNYSEDGKILTLHEIDGGSGHSIRIPSGLVHHAKKSVLKRTLFFF